MQTRPQPTAADYAEAERAAVMNAYRSAYLAFNGFLLTNIRWERGRYYVKGKGRETSCLPDQLAKMTQRLASLAVQP